MCTLAWLSRTDGFDLWHSRDERRSRGSAMPPLVEYGRGVAWLSPRDSEAGGTWVGVNSFGVVVGLANLFVGGQPVHSSVKVSRGLLVHQLLDSPSAALVRRRVAAIDLAPYEPFTLVALETGQTPVVLRWDRSHLNGTDPLGAVLLVTSAGGSVAIEHARQRLFADEAVQGRLDAGRIEQLYRLPPNRDDASICLHRPEVSTVSLTRIEVRPHQVSLAYTPGQPCVTAAGPAIQLDRSDSTRSVS